MAELLSYQQKTAIVYRLAKEGKFSLQEGEIYILRSFGNGLTAKQLPYAIVAKKVGIRALRVIEMFKAVRDICDKAISAELERVLRIEVTEGVPEEDTPLYWGITQQIGHDTLTEDDYVPKLVIDPGSCDVTARPHVGEWEAEMLRIENSREEERKRNAEKRQRRNGFGGGVAA